MKKLSGCSQNRLDRRELLKVSGVAALAAGVAAREGSALPDPKLPLYGGYTNKLSYQPGDKVNLHISTPAKRYDLEIARIGAERETVWRKLDLQGYVHAVPENASTNGCKWPVAVSVTVPAQWKSGYYSVRLRGIDGGGQEVTSEMFFVLRSLRPGRGTRILMQLATNTYCAYNNWAGTSLYGGPNGQGRRVSFDRPYAGFAEPHGFTGRYSGWRRWEEPFVQWAERAGYAIDFAVNSDLEFHPEILKDYRLVLSVGHDEYWSSAMRDHLEAFIAAGGNAAFFSGNTCFWQVRSEDNGSAMTSWKQAYKEDPLYPSGDRKLLSTMWSNRLVQRPENQLTGVSFAYGGYHRFFEQFPDGTGAYTVHRPDHWIFKGTGVKRGDLLGSQDKIVGYECDGCDMELRDGLPMPTYRDGTPETFEILGTAPAGLSASDNSIAFVTEALYGEGPDKRHKQPGSAVLGIYKKGGIVLTSGCTDWPFGLRGGDRAVESITRNILDKLST